MTRKALGRLGQQYGGQTLVVGVLGCQAVGDFAGMVTTLRPAQGPPF
ncbi:MAG: hypothetical protein ACYTEX_24475 [Planctomycetota bacterium]